MVIEHSLDTLWNLNGIRIFLPLHIILLYRVILILLLYGSGIM